MKLFNTIAAAAVIGTSFIAANPANAGNATCQYIIDGGSVQNAPCTLRTRNRGDRFTVYAADNTVDFLYTLYKDGSASVVFGNDDKVAHGKWWRSGDRPMIRIGDATFSYFY